MKRKTAVSGIAVLIGLLVYGMGAWLEISPVGKAKRVITETDTGGDQRSSPKTEHEAYFTQHNPVSGAVK